MSRKEYAAELLRLYAEGMKTLKEGRIADKCRLFDRHDDMIANPTKYIR